MKKLLIIDDDEDIRFIVKMVLERSGAYQVQEADSALAGKTELAQFKPDILLLDYILPDAKGLDLLKELSLESRLSDVQVLVLTARKDPDLELEFLASGALAVLHKPFDPGEFQKTLETSLESG